MDIKTFQLLFILFISTTSLFSQVKMNHFEHQKPTEEYIFEPIDTHDLLDANYVNLEDHLPKGFVTDASVDYTPIIQRLLDQYRNVVFPGFPLLINENGLTISNNSNIYFLENSKLILKPNDKEHYEVLRIHNSSDIKIMNPVIIGDKDIHLDSKGEWGMGISIRGSAKNIEIYNANISSPWGDGIYLGHLRKIAPENIKIINATIDNAYRNGISITTGRNVEIKNTLISNSNYNGLKIEPSNSEAVFENILLKNINTFNNYGGGISVGGYSKLLENPNARLELEIINPRDCKSQDGMFFGMVSVKKKSKHPVKGYIRITNPEWLGNSNSVFTKRKFYKNIPEIQFFDLKDEYKKDIIFRHKKDRIFTSSLIKE